MKARRLVGLGLVVFGSGMVSGCALTVDKIRLDYMPQPNVQKVEQAESVSVKVNVQDIRARKDRVSSKKNGYGMEMAAIVAENDLSELVKDAINSELRSRGFGIGDGPAIVNVELQKYYCDYKVGFFASDEVAEVTMNVQVQRPDGAIGFAKVIAGEGKEPNVMLSSGTNAKVALDLALKDALHELFSDRKFLDALVAAGKVTVTSRISSGNDDTRYRLASVRASAWLTKSTAWRRFPN